MSETVDSEGGAKEGRQTIVILSRGARLAPMFHATATNLARDYRVVVIMFDRSEHAIWQNSPEFQCVDFRSEVEAEAARHESRLAERTREVEAEIGISLYKAASSYLLFRRFVNEYFGFNPPLYSSEREMMVEFVGSYGVLSGVIAEHRPVLVLHEGIDHISTVVTLAVAYQNNIFNLGLILAPGLGDGTMIMYYGLRRQNLIGHYLAGHPHLITDESRVKARHLISNVRRGDAPSVSHVEVRRSALASPWRSARQLLRAGALRKPSHFVQRVKNWLWLRRHLRHDMPKRPFILFLLHMQPEASTTSQAPRWVDQERIVEQMAINAPQGIDIVVKENPQSFGWRGEGYFGALARFENVHLAHPLVSTQDLLRRAEALVTITGSAGFEAILLGTRVAVLGRPFYADAPGVRKLEVPEQIFSELADPSWQRQTPGNIEGFVAAYLQSVHYLGEVLPGRKWPIPAVIGPRFADAVRRTLAFISANSLTPQQFDPGFPVSARNASLPQALARDVAGA